MVRVLAVTNAYPSPQHPEAGAFVEQQIVGLRRLGLDVDVMCVNRREKGVGSYFTMGAELQARMERFQPDVVHVMYGGVLAERVTRVVNDRPTVVSFCGSDLLGELLSGPIRRIASECGIFASQVAARRADGVIVKSRNLEESLPATVIRSKVRVIPNGIDLERFRPLDRSDCRNKLGWDSTKFHVLFPSTSGDPVKRPHLAQAAIEAANRSGLNTEMHRLRGVAHAEVPIWLNASDVVMLTSLHEGSPNIIKEALACDVPIISVDVGDVRERIGEIEGCHIALPDPRDLSSKLTLVRDGKRRIAGREKVRPLSLENISLLLQGFYREILESGRMRENSRSWLMGVNTLVGFVSSKMARKTKLDER